MSPCSLCSSLCELCVRNPVLSVANPPAKPSVLLPLYHLGNPKIWRLPIRRLLPNIFRHPARHHNVFAHSRVRPLGVPQHLRPPLPIRPVPPLQLPHLFPNLLHLPP